jgi:2-phosphoglycerate kinase
MNLNKFAKEIAEKEGIKKALSIAQIKEVMRLIFTKLASLPENEVTKILKRYSK